MIYSLEYFLIIQYEAISCLRKNILYSQWGILKIFKRHATWNLEIIYIYVCVRACVGAEG